jgi:hypothetical protein
MVCDGAYTVALVHVRERIAVSSFQLIEQLLVACSSAVLTSLPVAPNAYTHHFLLPLMHTHICLLQETSCGQFAGDCVATTARIMADAEGTLDHGGNYSFMRNFTPKPLPTIEVGDVVAFAWASAACCRVQVLLWILKVLKTLCVGCLPCLL